MVLWVAGCVGPVMIDGKPTPRIRSEYTGQPYVLRHIDAHPRPGGPSSGVKEYGGRINGLVCGSDVDVTGEGDETVGFEIEVQLRVVFGLSDGDHEWGRAERPFVRRLRIRHLGEGPDGAIVGAIPAWRGLGVWFVDEHLEQVAGVSDHARSARRPAGGKRHGETAEHTLEVVDALLVRLGDDRLV